MIQRIFHNSETDFEWIDVINPSVEEYEELASKYALHPAAVKDCLSPNHLPKCELIGNTLFVILRIRDSRANNEADDLRSLTNKVAIFSSDTYLITIHRKEEPFLNKIVAEWKDIKKVHDPSRNHLFNSFVHGVIFTFEKALTESEEELDRYEKQIFHKDKGSEKLIQNLYMVKRRASVFKRMLLLTKDTLIKFKKYDTAKDPFSTDLIESTESLWSNLAKTTPIVSRPLAGTSVAEDRITFPEDSTARTSSDSSTISAPTRSPRFSSSLATLIPMPPRF